MKLMKREIVKDQTVTTFFALESMQLRKSRKNQRNYLVVNLYDKSGKINGYLWNDPEEKALTLREKSFVKVRGLTAMSNGSLIIDIERIREASKDEIDMRDFLEVAPGGIDLWHKRLIKTVETIGDVHCRQLVESFLDDNGFLELFITNPGGLMIHHNYVGGLLEHTTSAMELLSFFAERHPGLINRDLLLTGAFLHDIGKTREIYWEISREYTTEGKLLGHIALGSMMLEEKISKIMHFPADLANRLRHMVLSHHGSLEHGSPVRPATPEALLLNLVEATDAKLNHLYRHMGNSDPAKDWSDYDRILETQIYQKPYAGAIEQVPAVAA